MSEPTIIPPSASPAPSIRDPFQDPQVGDTLEAEHNGNRVFIQIHYNNGEWVGYVKRYGANECQMQRTTLANWRENSRVAKVLSDEEVAAIPDASYSIDNPPFGSAEVAG